MSIYLFPSELSVIVPIERGQRFVTADERLFRVIRQKASARLAGHCVTLDDLVAGYREILPRR